MRLISGTIAAEEKGRVARVGKVIKIAIYFNFLPSIAQQYLHLALLIKHYILCFASTFYLLPPETLVLS
jgi:hypothetical protein